MTEKIFYTDSYKKRFTARVVSCEGKKGHWEIILNRTAFYPEGGGQVADIGVIKPPSADFNVEGTQRVGALIIHSGQVKQGRFSRGDAVESLVEAERRISTMTPIA